MLTSPVYLAPGLLYDDAGTLRDSELQELRAHEQGQSAPFQLPPSLQEAANRQYDRDVAALHPDAQHEPMDSAYNDFIQELGHEPAPRTDRWAWARLGHASLRQCKLFSAHLTCQWCGCLTWGLPKFPQERRAFKPM